MKCYACGSLVSRKIVLEPTAAILCDSCRTIIAVWGPVIDEKQKKWIGNDAWIIIKPGSTIEPKAPNFSKIVVVPVVKKSKALDLSEILKIGNVILKR